MTEQHPYRRPTQWGRLAERWFGPIVLTGFALAVVLGLQTYFVDEPVLEGAGATFPAPLYDRWIALYDRQHHTRVTYDAVGSGAGIDAIVHREVQFGASDARLSQTDRRHAPGRLVELPMVLGPVAIIYNLPGLDREIALDGPTLADVYLGKIQRWNDPRITALNPGLDLPDTPIRVTHREDSSGTSFIFTDYLSAVSPQWATEVGADKEPAWSAGHGGVGNDGVAQQVLVRPGGIGYVELTYAHNAGLDVATLINRSGQPVRPTPESVQAAERSASTDRADLPTSIVDAPDEAAYPIAGFTYLLVYDDLGYLDTRRADVLLHFVRWALTEGQSQATDLGYAPLPEELAHATLAKIDEIAANTER